MPTITCHKPKVIPCKPYQKAVFYISGGIGTIWFIVWMLMASNNPETHFLISADEKEKIVNFRRPTYGVIGKETPPYKKIILTPSIWAMAFCDLAMGIGTYLIIIEGPNFVANILNKDIKSVRN